MSKETFKDFGEIIKVRTQNSPFKPKYLLSVFSGGNDCGLFEPVVFITGDIEKSKYDEISLVRNQSELEVILGSIPHIPINVDFDYSYKKDCTEGTLFDKLFDNLQGFAGFAGDFSVYGIIILDLDERESNSFFDYTEPSTVTKQEVHYVPEEVFSYKHTIVFENGIDDV